MSLQTIYRNRPDLLVPIFEVPLRAPEVPHPAGMGVAPILAVILLYMNCPGDEVTNEVAKYLHRPELADDELLYTITGIIKLPVTPDALAAELVRSLDRSNEKIKIEALMGLAKAEPSFKAANQMRIERMANDPEQTERVRQLAAEVLKGKVPGTPTTGVGNPPTPKSSSRVQASVVSFRSIRLFARSLR